MRFCNRLRKPAQRSSLFESLIHARWADPGPATRRTGADPWQRVSRGCSYLTIQRRSRRSCIHFLPGSHAYQAGSVLLIPGPPSTTAAIRPKAIG